MSRVPRRGVPSSGPGAARGRRGCAVLLLVLAVFLLHPQPGRADPDVGRNYYYLAVFAQEEGKPDEAAQHLQAALSRDPQNPLYLRLQTELASGNAGLSPALTHPTPEARTPAPSRRAWHLAARVGFAYDDNVPLDPDDLDLFSRQSDTLALAMVGGRLEIPWGEGFQVGLGLTHKQTRHARLSEFDLAQTTGSAGVRYRRERASVELAYQPSFTWLDGEGYRARHRAAAEVGWRFGPRAAGALRYAYDRDHYLGDDSRDGHTQLGGAEWVRFIGTEGALLRVGLGGLRRSASSTDQDYREGEVRIGGKLPVGRAWSLGAEAGAAARSYENEDTVFDVRRRDTRFRAHAGVSRPLFARGLSWTVEYDHTTQRSNVEEFQYRRNLWAIVLTGEVP